MSKLIIQDKTKTGCWCDVGEVNSREEVKSWLEKNVFEYDPNNLRIVQTIAHCKTKVILIDDISEEVKSEDIKDIQKKESRIDDEQIEQIRKANEEKKPQKKVKKSAGNVKHYTDDDLKLLYFKRSCELGHWAKTNEFDNLDRDEYPSWFTFHYNLGSKSNVVDAVIFELKKEKMPKEYQEVIKEYYGPNHTGIYVIKKLAEGAK